jgi:hypothetical protein
MAKSTIGSDPFASVIPFSGGEPAELVPPSPEPHGVPARPSRPFQRKKLTVHVREDLVERVKNAAYWNPRLTIASIAELGIDHAIDLVEKEHGGPYPAREEELRGGRPIK